MECERMENCHTWTWTAINSDVLLYSTLWWSNILNLESSTQWFYRFIFSWKWFSFFPLPCWFTGRVMRLTTTSKDNFPWEGPPCLRVSTVSWNSTAVDVKKFECFGVWHRWLTLLIVILLMDKILHHQGWWWSHYLQGFMYPRWCRISSINSKMMLH